jgi:hypothetical protein
MSVTSQKMPKYDDKVNYILRSLAAGITREQLAEEYGHSGFRAIDMYMRRRNFRWSSIEQNYVPVGSKLGTRQLIGENIHPGKVSRILDAFSKGMDPKTVANEFGFKDHQDLADYMTKKGYEWSNEDGNYVRKKGLEKDKESSNLSSAAEKEEKINPEQSFMIKALYKKFCMDTNPIIDWIPHYMLPGIAKTKSLQMSHLLIQLVEDFSSEKNITQRAIFESAIIEFLQKYGYKHEVETLLGR